MYSFRLCEDDASCVVDSSWVLPSSSAPPASPWLITWLPPAVTARPTTSYYSKAALAPSVPSPTSTVVATILAYYRSGTR